MESTVFVDLLPINELFFFCILPALGILDLIACRRVSRFWHRNALWCVRSLPSLHPNFPSPCDLSMMPNLTALDLRYNESLVDQDFEALTKLQFINLSHNMFVGDGGLVKLTNLRGLSVSHNQMITEQVMPHLRSLTHIDPRCSNLTEYPDEKRPSLLLPRNLIHRRFLDSDNEGDDSAYPAKCDDGWVVSHRWIIPYKKCCGAYHAHASCMFFHSQCAHVLDTTLGFGTLLERDK